ncbi:hypothetical protein ABGB07_02220 [Micromonosporaceae bacterium B7E4]
MIRTDTIWLTGAIWFGLGVASGKAALALLGALTGAAAMWISLRRPPVPTTSETP